MVLEGGPNTVATVYEAITQDPAVPVVVIKDSGRAADLLAYAHNISHGEGSVQIFVGIIICNFFNPNILIKTVNLNILIKTVV